MSIFRHFGGLCRLSDTLRESCSFQMCLSWCLASAVNPSWTNLSPYPFFLGIQLFESSHITYKEISAFELIGITYLMLHNPYHASRIYYT